MLQESLRNRIKALKRIIPEDGLKADDVVIDLRDDVTIDLTGATHPSWVHDERIVPAGPGEFALVPARGLGAIPPTAAEVFHTLDQTDRELAHLIASGMDAAEIATVLDVAPTVAEFNVRTLLSLTGFATRVDLMAAWHRGVGHT